jgi:hypothetical protein
VNKIKAWSFLQLEDQVNKTLNLKNTKGSGNQYNDGDGKGYGQGYISLLAECKYTQKEKKSISIKKPDFLKIQKSAEVYGRLPILCTADADGDIYIHMKIEDFKRILDNNK